MTSFIVEGQFVLEELKMLLVDSLEEIKWKFKVKYGHFFYTVNPDFDHIWDQILTSPEVPLLDQILTGLEVPFGIKEKYFLFDFYINSLVWFLLFWTHMDFYINSLVLIHLTKWYSKEKK